MAFLPTGAGIVVLETRLADGVVYGVLGPFPAGSIIRRMIWWVNTRDDGVTVLGATIGVSNEATAVAFRSGRSIVARSDTTHEGHPSLRFHFAAAYSGMFWMPVGVRVTGGPSYIIAALSVTHVLFMRANIGVEAVLPALVKGPNGTPLVNG